MRCRMPMDDGQFQALKAAYVANPDNRALLVVFLRACLDAGRAADACAALDAGGAAAVDSAEARALAARACLQAGRAEQAIGFATDETGEALLVRARALLALERREEGRTAYERAIAANPALEDVDLATEFTIKVRTYDSGAKAGAGGPRLRAISNDDTVAEDVDRTLAPPEAPVTFADVGGLDEVKAQIRARIILPFQKPSLFRRFKKRIGGGILLYGPPGCGKTLLARATAGECAAAFYSIAISDILDMYIGESERKLHAIFERARAKTPSVLFFDELEALAGKREYAREGTTAKMVSQFLSEMDGFAQDNHGVLVLGATNVPWAVDPAFRRPGRFDRVLFVPPPDQAARAGILRILLRDRPVAGDVDPDALATRTSTFSGADLGNVVETAADHAIARSLAEGRESVIASADLRAAIEEVKPTALEWLGTARNYARYANESGQYDEVLDFLRKNSKA
jgi:AAA+ superfamily predicted ATPase